MCSKTPPTPALPHKGGGSKSFFLTPSSRPGPVLARDGSGWRTCPLPPCGGGLGWGGSPRGQAGFSLVLVLFLLVIVSLLVAAMAQLNRGGSAMLSQEVLSTRALFAAESGAQALAMRLFPMNDNTVQACPAAQQLAFATPGLTGCRAEVQCSSAVVDAFTVYTLRSVGECSSAGCTAAACTAAPEMARRRIETALRTLP